MFAKIIFGAKGSLVVKIVIIINNFGLCCAYFSKKIFNFKFFYFYFYQFIFTEQIFSGALVNLW